MVVVQLHISEFGVATTAGNEVAAVGPHKQAPRRAVFSSDPRLFRVHCAMLCMDGNLLLALLNCTVVLLHPSCMCRLMDVHSKYFEVHEHLLMHTTMLRLRTMPCIT